MSAPFDYTQLNCYNSVVSPSTVHVHNTALSRFYQRYLIQKAISVFKWKMPEEWAENYFLYSLYGYGFVVVFNTDKFGVIPQHCGLSGYDVFYQPTHATIANPLLTGFIKPRIGAQCVLIRLQPDYGGLWDLVGYYADLMALCSETASTNILNSKLSYVFTAESKTFAEGFKKMYDRFASGEPAVIIDKAAKTLEGKPNWEAFTQNVGQNYITSDILSDMRKIEMMFDTDIGIPNANTDKRERLIESEVEANNIEVASKCELWLENLKRGCREVKNMFGTEITVDWRVNPREADTYDSDNIATGDVPVRQNNT